MADDPTARAHELTTADGLVLEAELCVPHRPVAAIVLAHPHPAQGGSMRSLVTSELFRTLPGRGLAALRFNFRGVEGSEGVHGDGADERLDLVAAVDAVDAELTALPIVVAGWSFGADVSLSVVDRRIDGWFAIAPPLRVLPLADLLAGTDPRPKVLAVPEHDQFCPPDAAAAATSDWTNTEIVIVPGADHFLVGRTDVLTERLVTFATHL